MFRTTHHMDSTEWEPLEPSRTLWAKEVADKEGGWEDDSASEDSEAPSLSSDDEWEKVSLGELEGDA